MPFWEAEEVKDEVQPAAPAPVQGEADDALEAKKINSVEREMIRKALLLYNGRRKLAAEKLGISERTLYRKIKEYGLE